MDFDKLVERVKDHADAGSVDMLGAILSHENLSCEMRVVAGRGKCLIVRNPFEPEHIAHVWIDEGPMAYLGRGHEWVVAAGPRRNYIKMIGA